MLSQTAVVWDQVDTQGDRLAFYQALQSAVNAATNSDDLITFGIVPAQQFIYSRCDLTIH